MHLFKKLFLSLNKASIKYMVAGGIAVNLYGIERATADLDIALELEKGIFKIYRCCGKAWFEAEDSC